MKRPVKDVECVWDLRATLGESPIWSPAQQAVWLVDVKQQCIHQMKVDSQQVTTWSVPEQIGFIAPLDERYFIAGLQSGLHRFDSANGTLSLLQTVESHLPDNRLNDSYIDNQGRLWFGSMDNKEQERTGALYRFDKNGFVSRVEGGICITNGPCMSPDGRVFYHTDTVNRTMYVYDVNDDGSLTNRRVFKQFDNYVGYPDGSIVDAEGCIWTAMWGGWMLLRHSPDGEHLDTIQLPCSNVTKAVFGGRGMNTLYIATARKGLSEMELAEQPKAGGVFAVEVEVAGLPVQRVDRAVAENVPPAGTGG